MFSSKCIQQSFRAIVAGLLGAGLLAVAGCGGGGGSGSMGGANLLPPGTTFNKAIRLSFQEAPANSVISATVSTQPRVENIRTIRLVLYEGTTNETAVQKDVSQAVPPLSGQIIVNEVTPGDHLIEVKALDDSGNTIFGGDFVSRFLPGEPSFVDFTGAPVASVSEFNYHGGQLPEVPFTYLITKAGSPYSIDDAINIPAGVRVVIEPGVTLQFTPSADTVLDDQGDPFPAHIRVAGRLTAVGTATEPIVMSRSQSGISTKVRILFVDDQPDPIQSRVRFCDISQAKAGVELQGSDVSISGNSFHEVQTGIISSKGSTSRIASNTVQASQAGIVIVSSTTPVTGNQIVGGEIGVQLFASVALVENNSIRDVSLGLDSEGFLDFTFPKGSGIHLKNSHGAIVKNNTIEATSGVLWAGVRLENSNATVSENRVSRFSSQAELIVGVDVVATVSTSTSQRLLLDHNTLTGASFANLAIIKSDPMVQFNEISGGTATDFGPGMGVAVDLIGGILPKQPNLILNNIVDNEWPAVAFNAQILGNLPPGVEPGSGPVHGGAVLGSADAGFANYVAGNFLKVGADTLTGGSVDGSFTTTTPQVFSADAVLSTTDVAIRGAGVTVSSTSATVE